jgi:hypothetical protein
MANVVSWTYNSVTIKFKKDKFNLGNSITVDSAIMDADVQCFHCGKNIKAGKLVFCANVPGNIPAEKGNKDWGNFSRRTFCSSNHAKLFAKNTNGNRI